MKTCTFCTSFLLLSLLIDSCTDPNVANEPGTPHEGKFGGSESGDVLSLYPSANSDYGVIQVNNESQTYPAGSAATAILRAQFSSDTISSRTLVDAGEVTIASATLSKDVGYGSTYYSATTNTNSTDGVQVIFSVAGNSTTGVPAFTDSLYVSDVLTVTAPTFDTTAGGFVADKSTGLSVSWSTDASTDSCFIVLTYLAAKDTAGFGDIYPHRYWWVHTADDGAYTFSSEILSAFTANNVTLLMTIVRGTTKRIAVGSKNYFLKGTSSALTPLLLVP